MSIGPLVDPVARTVVTALTGVSTRLAVTADNLANASTPNYREKQVNFEDALAAAVAGGRPPESVTPTVSMSDSPVQADGNSVDVTKNAMELDTDQLTYQSLVNALNFRMNIIKDGL